MKLNGKTPLRALALSAVAAAALLAAETMPARAHPHVWISATTDVVFNEDGKVIAIDISWEFDEFYSLTAVEGMDTDGNGAYESSELEPLARENITALEDFGYFTEIINGSETVKPAKVEEFQSTFKDGLLSLVFRVPLPTPLDPKKAAVSYRMFDPSFFIAIEYAPSNPVGTIGTLPAGCSVKVIPADGDSDDVPFTEEDFANTVRDQGLGGLYAETASIECSGKPES